MRQAISEREIGSIFPAMSSMMLHAKLAPPRSRLPAALLLLLLAARPCAALSLGASRLLARDGVSAASAVQPVVALLAEQVVRDCAFAHLLVHGPSGLAFLDNCAAAAVGRRHRHRIPHNQLTNFLENRAGLLA